MGKKNFHKNLFMISTCVAVLFFLLFFTQAGKTLKQKILSPLPGEIVKKKFLILSIDTMKYSRDLASQKINNPSFDATIEAQMRDIANTGATYVAIGTPYDEQFLPILRRWVAAARKYNLHIWFRGNFSGWERWFGFAAIDRQTHILKTEQFIVNNADLFQNGDIFSSCPECENGTEGDPRKTGDVAGYRKFLIDEYSVSKSAFERIGKKVQANFDSMNADVARLIMDKQTTKALGGLVVIDHYVSTPQDLAQGVKDLAKLSGGKVMLGEFGVPVDDLTGEMTEEQQATWIKSAIDSIVQVPELAGMNYWVNVGGSTQLWNSDGQVKKAAETIAEEYLKLQNGI